MILTAGLSAVPNFAKAVRPVLERRCFSCHGPKEQKGKLRLDTLSTDLVQDARAAHPSVQVLLARMAIGQDCMLCMCEHRDGLRVADVIKPVAGVHSPFFLQVPLQLLGIFQSQFYFASALPPLRYFSYHIFPFEF